MCSSQVKPDIDSPEHIRQFIDLFYARVLKDDILAPIFIDVAGIDLEQHLHFIRRYWEKLLLGDDRYHRHTMNIHRRLNKKFPLSERAFKRWVELFVSTAEANFAGPQCQRAIRVATQIAANMQKSLASAETG